MIRLETLKPAEGSVKDRKRIGRGEGSKRGGTATKGHKGAQSRSGYSRKLGFEGGQMPLQRRVPKFGFKNRFRVEYQGINLDQLEEIIAKTNTDTIDKEFLISNGLANKNELIKILGRGEIKSKVTITVDSFSSTAKAAIEKVGGVANTI